MAIVLDGDTCTDDERVALAAAERGDVTYLGGPAISATVNFTASSTGVPGTIRLANGANWVGLTQGLTIKVDGSSANANTYFKIASVVGNVVTLSTDDKIVAETGRNVSILPVVLDPHFTALSGPASVAVTFVNRGNDSSGNRLGDTITRTSGSWITDGYVVGSLVESQATRRTRPVIPGAHRGWSDRQCAHLDRSRCTHHCCHSNPAGVHPRSEARRDRASHRTER